MTQAASYWHAPSSKPYRWVTVPQLIDEWAEKKPNGEAYVLRMLGSPREAVTFLQLQQKTEALAAGLLEHGLRPGDFVIISGITCMNWILADFACASIGVHTVRCEMSVLTRAGGLSTICSRSNIKAIFYHPGENEEFEDHLMKCIPNVFAANSQKNTEQQRKRNEDNNARKEERPESKNVETSMISVSYLIKLNASSKKTSAIDLNTLVIQSGELIQSP